MDIFSYTRRLAMLGLVLSGLSSPTFSQQVFDGTHAVPPLYQGQTRAPLALKSPTFNVTEFVTSLHRPWTMVHMPNGKMMVTEVPGRIRIITNKGSVSEPIDGVPAVRAWGSRGLNDIILDPNFKTNRTLYFTYLAPPPNVKSDNSDKRYKQFAKERLEWNKLSRQEKRKKT